jgi:hypothetical protein
LVVGSSTEFVAAFFLEVVEPIGVSSKNASKFAKSFSFDMLFSDSDRGLSSPYWSLSFLLGSENEGDLSSRWLKVHWDGIGSYDAWFCDASTISSNGISPSSFAIIERIHNDYFFAIARGCK